MGPGPQRDQGVIGGLELSVPIFMEGEGLETELISNDQ